MALKDMFTAPHCRICYDKVNVFSDIVFGDPWCMDDVDWNAIDFEHFQIAVLAYQDGFAIGNLPICLRTPT